jgi:hypothetical protein
MKVSFFSRSLTLGLLMPSILLIFACGGKKASEEEAADSGPIVKVKPAPFSADSAYAFLKKQLDFGYRIPGTEAHKRCSEWLFATLKRYCDTVYLQKTTVQTWDKKTIPVYNIVGVFNPRASMRGLYASHWDSRRIADADPNPAKRNQPIAAANDGASGVAVLLELARQLKKQKPAHGIDIIFFDAEDWGNPGSEYPDSYCLGSQYWGKTPHKPAYRANYGVLLDMVGGKNAMFAKEGYSEQNAGFVLNHTWAIAGELGYGNTFIGKQSGPITDDHYYVMKLNGTPMIDIIQHDPNRGTFAEYWHTHADNLESIDPATLQIVGNTISALVFNPPISITQ